MFSPGYDKISLQGGDSINTVIGLTGSWRSGCSTVASYYEANHGFRKFSLSDGISQTISSIQTAADIDRYLGPTIFLPEEGGTDRLTSDQVYTKLREIDSLSELKKRGFLQDLGNAIRERTGHDSLIRQLGLEAIHDTDIVIDGIKNKSEHQFLSDSFINYYLININATFGIRKSSKRDISDDDFYKIDIRDSEESRKPGFEYGQQVSDCVDLSDIVILNNDRSEDGLADLYTVLAAKLEIIKGKKEAPSLDELFMTAAYVISLRSRCLKRRVGAVITKEDHIIGSGFNDVPFSVDTIQSIKTCGSRQSCYRDRIIDRFDSDYKPGQKPSSVEESVVLRQLFDKHLDLCQAVHAEERAILQVAKFGGISLKGSRLYTTTFPCKLCAKKIIEVGIREIVYCEPYPSENTTQILLSGGVSLRQFEGVKAKAFFKLYGYTGGFDNA